MSNTFSRTGDSQQQAPAPYSVPVSVSISQTHEDNFSTQSHACQSKSLVSESKESLIILKYQDKLISALLANTLSIARVLSENEFISDEIFGRSLHPSSTSQEKATILVDAIREKIRSVPERFSDLILVFSKQVSTKDIAGMLQSAYQDKSKFIHDLLIFSFIAIIHFVIFPRALLECR